MYQNIAIVGGIKTGKTSLVDALMEEDPTINRISMARYGIGIPVTLMSAAGYTDLLEKKKEDYIKMILKNKHIPLIDIKGRMQEIYGFKMKVREKYGPTIMAETILRTLIPGVQNLVDHVTGINDALCFSKRGFYIVGLHCDFPAKLGRSLERGKDPDSNDRVNLEELQNYIVSGETLLESRKTIQMSDVVYDTSDISTELCQELARKILAATRKRKKK